MNATKNDLPQKTRTAVAAILNQRLADAIDLSTQIKAAHWNVKGPNFIALHELFDKVYDSVEAAIDDIAERCVALGGTAMGTARVAAKVSSLDEYPARTAKWTDHVEAVTDRLAAFGKLVRKAIDETDKLGDKDTADLFTEVSREIDKMLWFVESHLQ
jgi:starvation-inducible DNA-binding protein